MYHRQDNQRRKELSFAVTPSSEYILNVFKARRSMTLTLTRVALRE